MTIPQAESLLSEVDAVDGHRELGRGILDIALALTGAKKPDGNGEARHSRPAAPEAAEILIPELRAVVEGQMRAEGWQPPPEPAPGQITSPGQPAPLQL